MADLLLVDLFDVVFQDARGQVQEEIAQPCPTG